MASHPNIARLKWFSLFIDLRLYGPFAILYFAETAGSFTLGMLVFGTVSVVSALCEIPTGMVSDRAGRKLTMASGALFSFFAILSYALASDVSLLLVGATLEGLSRSLFSGTNAALLHDSLSEDGNAEQYHHHFGRMGSMLQLGLATGALLGGVLGLWSLNLIFWLTLFPQAIAVILAFTLVEPKRVIDTKTTNFTFLLEACRHLIANKRLTWLAIAQSVGFGFGEANFQFVAAFFRTLWPLWAIGLLRTAAHGMASAGYWLSGPIIDRFSHYRVIIFSSTYGQGANIIGLLMANVFSPILMTSPSFLYGVNQTAKNHLFQKEFSDEQRATLGSIVQLSGSIVFFFASLLIGWVADVFSPQTALLTSYVAQIWVIPIYIWLFHQEK